MANFRVNILGCSSATQSGRHQQSCQVIDFRDKLFMIDCGEGAQAMFRRQGLKFSRLRHIFISHLHGDHFFGLPGLLSTMSLHDVEGTVTIHLFADGGRLLDQWMQYFNRAASFDIHYDIITPGSRDIIYEDSGLTVQTFPLYHRVDCTGFIFREKPKLRHLRGDMIRFHQIPIASLQAIKEGADYVKPDGTVIPNAALTTPADPSVTYAYCSDTMADPRMLPDLRGVNAIYHEATYDSSLEHLARERGHSTARQAAETARAVGADTLILGHFSKRYADPQAELRLLDEAREVFPRAILADEGLQVDLI